VVNVDNRYIGDDYISDNENWHEGDASWKAAQVLRMITSHDLRPDSVCDIGCGTGGVLDELHGRLPDSPSLVGYEISPRAVDLIPRDRLQRIEVVNGSHDVDARTFDLMLVLDVFEHVEDYYGFLRAIQAKAALAIFHVPIDTAVTSVLRPEPILRSSKIVGHIQHFTRVTALEALRHAGYEIIDAWHTVPAREQTPTSTRQRVGRAARLTAARLDLDVAAKWLTGFPLLVLARSDGGPPASAP
jgi:SAM-dependent methyltransferase